MFDIYAVAYALRTDEIDRLRALPYREYLRSDWWQWKRDRAIKRARECCELCRLPGGGLQVHHTTYERLGHERNDDLVVLCRDCHEHVTHNGLGRLPRHELLARRREILHSPEFQRSRSERLRF